MKTHNSDDKTDRNQCRNIQIITFLYYRKHAQLNWEFCDALTAVSVYRSLGIQ